MTKLLKDFWKRWASEYLTFLRQFQVSGVTKDKMWPSDGDVVLVFDDGPRILWKVGRIVQLLGTKGNHRVAHVKTG